MKKYKLLIPALSLASVGVVMTPMLTSCNPYVEYHLSFAKYVDGASQTYENLYKYATSETYLKQADMAKAYFAEVRNDPNIFADDLMTFLSTLSSTPYKSKTLTISNTMVENNLMFFKECVTALSFEFHLDQKNYTSHEVISYKITNMPYYLSATNTLSEKKTTLIPIMYYLDKGQASLEKALELLLISKFNIQISYKQYTIVDEAEILKTDIFLETKNLDDLMLLLDQESTKSLLDWLKLSFAAHYYTNVTVNTTK